MSSQPGPSHNLDVPTTPLKVSSSNGRETANEDDPDDEFMTEETIAGVAGRGDASEGDSSDDRHPRHRRHAVSNLPSMPIEQVKRQQNAFTFQVPPVVIQNIVATCNLGEWSSLGGFENAAVTLQAPKSTSSSWPCTLAMLSTTQSDSLP